MSDRAVGVLRHAAVLPGEIPDKRHLSQFTHSEAEIPGGLDDVIAYVEGYVKALAAAMLDQYGGRLAGAIGDVSHLERMAGHDGPFARITFAEAVQVLGARPGCIHHQGTWRRLTDRGERELMRRVGEFVWVTHFDHLAVPFYQASGTASGLTATNADLLFGIGEVVGSASATRLARRCGRRSPSTRCPRATTSGTCR